VLLGNYSEGSKGRFSHKRKVPGRRDVVLIRRTDGQGLAFGCDKRCLGPIVQVRWPPFRSVRSPLLAQVRDLMNLAASCENFVPALADFHTLVFPPSSCLGSYLLLVGCQFEAVSGNQSSWPL